MKENKPQSTSENNPSFQKKVWIVVGILAFSIITLLLLKATFRVFLLILAGALIAIFFRGLSSFIQKKTKWKEGICVAISIISTFLIVIGLFWLIGAKVQDQMAELVETLPKTVENAKAKLNESSIGRTIVDNFSSRDSIEKAQGFAGQFFQSTFGFFGDLYVILFIGIFFTISPKTYINGLVQLIPIKGQETGRQVLNNISNQLLNWLKGTFFSMFIVFVLTAVGLAIIGIPLWLVLALLAGLICFIPNFGPLIALIPAVLIGLLQSPETALLVAGLYILIQFIESNFITTLVQKKLLNLPPALIIIAQLIMGTLTGIWGLVLATPIIVILIVLVQDLYIKNRE
ncbi:AI-2E family transporter [Formosa haliotis]|uniref:AI-2E family transporter n=1 Tax=Formosa haliotis TaxID=1555194 RepID=UPI00082586A6|nr:AI-2E family transporter [Formosa haliotis]